jgi:hypothetical protein
VAGSQVGRLRGKGQVDDDRLVGAGEGLVGLPAVLVAAAAVDVVDPLGGEQVVVAVTAPQRVVAIAGAQPVGGRAAAYVEVLDAGEIDPVAGVVVVVDDAGVAGG